MNKLQDAPELKAEFDKASDEFGLLFAPKPYRITAEHFFIAGYQAAVAERAKFDEENGLIFKDLCNTHEVKPQPEKPQRTIAEVHQLHDGFFVISNDRKMYHWQGNEMGWYPLPDLPQD